LIHQRIKRSNTSSSQSYTATHQHSSINTSTQQRINAATHQLSHTQQHINTSTVRQQHNHQHFNIVININPSTSTSTQQTHQYININKPTSTHQLTHQHNNTPLA
jgi:hypothetical protein